MRSIGVSKSLRRRSVSAPKAAASAPRAQLMMSAPDFFEVSYSINPWMHPDQWRAQAHRLALDAQRGWTALKAQYEALGAAVWVQPAQRGLPDLVFTANAGFVLDRTLVPARFMHPERQGEQAHNAAFFNALQAHGLIERMVPLPPELIFEGAGDAIWDASRAIIWTGWGQRSSQAVSSFLARTYGVQTVSLELVDPRFYHLDTCFCALSRGDILVYPPALRPASFAQLGELVGSERLIIASDDDAMHLAVNSVCIGNDVVLCHASSALREGLAARGYRVHVVGLESFNRSGGAAYCLTLRLDQCTAPAAAQA